MDLVSVLAEVFGELPTIGIERYLGRTGVGDSFAPLVNVPGLVDEKRRLVRDATGSQAVSEATVWIDIPADTVAPRSRVRLPSGRITQVLAVTVNRGNGEPEIPEHLELACQ